MDVNVNVNVSVSVCECVCLSVCDYFDRGPSHTNHSQLNFEFVTRQYGTLNRDIEKRGEREVEGDRVCKYVCVRESLCLKVNVCE